MANLESTCGSSWALRELVFGIPWDIVTLDLPCMTRFTEVSVSPAEPLCDWATELALKLYVVSSMLFAVLDPRSHAHSRALTTHQFLWLVLLALLLSPQTILESTEICRLAFETLIVGELKHRVGLQVIVEIFRFQLFVFVDAFELGTLQGFPLDLFLKFPMMLWKFIVNQWALFCLNVSLALWAFKVVENNTWSRPLALESGQETVLMEDVTALKQDWRSVVKSFNLADCAVVIACLSQSECFVLFDTVFIKAREALGLSADSIAIVSASKDLVTRMGHEVHAVGRAAHLSESRFHRWWRLCQLGGAETALLSLLEVFVLLASLSWVIRLGTTLGVSAEVLIALVASQSIPSHEFSYLLADWVSINIFLIHVYLSLNHLHYVPTAASNQTVSRCNKLVGDQFLQVLILIFIHEFLDFKVLHRIPAVCLRALNLLSLLCRGEGKFLKAQRMNQVKAVCALEALLLSWLLIKMCEVLLALDACIVLLLFRKHSHIGFRVYSALAAMWLYISFVALFIFL